MKKKGISTAFFRVTKFSRRIYLAIVERVLRGDFVVWRWSVSERVGRRDFGVRVVDVQRVGARIGCWRWVARSADKRRDYGPEQTVIPLQNRINCLLLLPPANEVCEGYVFTGVCLSTGGGRAWLLQGGVVHGCSRGGMRGCSGGACMVAPGGHAWLLWGGGMRGFFDEIRSMSGRYASYWNAFLLLNFFHNNF